MAEKFFNRIADDVLQVTEKIQAVMEEGVSVLLTGELPSSTKASSSEQSSSTSSSSSQQEFSVDDIDDLDIDNLSEEEIQQLLDEKADIMMQHSPLKGIADDVMGNIMVGNVGPQTPLEHFHAFRSAIRWSEKFIIGLLTFQFIMFLLCLFVSRKDRGLTPRVCVLVFIGAVVRSAEWLNSLGAKYWERFATQDYFDNRGVFVAIMLSGPLLLDSLMMLFMFVSEASSLLIQVKRAEIKQKKKKEQGSKNNAKKQN